MSTNKGNAITNGLQFLKESRKELRKVVFPTRKETTAVTIAVLISVFFAGFYFAVVDYGLSELVKYLLR